MDPELKSEQINVWLLDYEVEKWVWLFFFGFFFFVLAVIAVEKN
jgi:hypothetical protein